MNNLNENITTANAPLKYLHTFKLINNPPNKQNTKT